MKSLAANRTIIHFITGCIFKDTVYSSAVTWNKFSSMRGKECCPNAFLMRAKQREPEINSEPELQSRRTNRESEATGTWQKVAETFPQCICYTKLLKYCSLSGGNAAAFLMMVAADNVAAVMEYNPGSEPERAPDLLETRRERISTRNDCEGKWPAEKS